MYWRLTPEEVFAVLREVAQRERAASLRAALVAATIVNVHRRKGARLVQPEDFLEDRSERQYMTPQQGAQFMRQWARQVNREFQHKSGNEGGDVT